MRDESNKFAPRRALTGEWDDALFKRVSKRFEVKWTPWPFEVDGHGAMYYDMEEPPEHICFPVSWTEKPRYVLTPLVEGGCDIRIIEDEERAPYWYGLGPAISGDDLTENSRKDVPFADESYVMALLDAWQRVEKQMVEGATIEAMPLLQSIEEAARKQMNRCRQKALWLLGQMRKMMNGWCAAAIDDRPIPSDVSPHPVYRDRYRWWREQQFNYDIAHNLDLPEERRLWTGRHDIPGKRPSYADFLAGAVNDELSEYDLLKYEIERLWGELRRREIAPSQLYESRLRDLSRQMGVPDLLARGTSAALGELYEDLFGLDEASLKPNALRAFASFAQVQIIEEGDIPTREGLKNYVGSTTRKYALMTLALLTGLEKRGASFDDYDYTRLNLEIIKVFKDWTVKAKKPTKTVRNRLLKNQDTRYVADLYSHLERWRDEEASDYERRRLKKMRMSVDLYFQRNMKEQ